MPSALIGVLDFHVTTGTSKKNGCKYYEVIINNMGLTIRLRNSKIRQA